MRKSVPPRWRWISRRPRASWGASQPRPRFDPGLCWSRRALERSATPPPQKRLAQTDRPPALDARSHVIMRSLRYKSLSFRCVHIMRRSLTCKVNVMTGGCIMWQIGALLEVSNYFCILVVNGGFWWTKAWELLSELGFICMSFHIF